MLNTKGTNKQKKSYIVEKEEDDVSVLNDMNDNILLIKNDNNIESDIIEKDIIKNIRR